MGKIPCLAAMAALVVVPSLTPKPVRAQRPADEPTFVFATDPVDSLLGLGHLRTRRLPLSPEEVRIWLGFGVVQPNVLVRLTTSSGTTRGQFYFWGETPGELPADFAARLRARAVAHTCAIAHNGMEWQDHTGNRVVQRRGWVYVCEVAIPAPRPDWRDFRARLVERGLFTLPDPSTLKGPAVEVTDGTSIQVEIRDGSRYRTYTYSNPDQQRWPEAARAQQIIEQLKRLTARIAPQQ